MLLIAAIKRPMIFILSTPKIIQCCQDRCIYFPLARSRLHTKQRPDNKDDMNNFIQLLSSVSIRKRGKPRVHAGCSAKNHAVEYVTHCPGCHQHKHLLIVHPWSKNVDKDLQQVHYLALNFCCGTLKGAFGRRKMQKCCT